MHYLSPASFLGDNFQLPLDARALQRERKRLLADLELTGGDTIELQGRHFTKNELIDYFEALQQGNIASWHLAITEDPVLLRFLQDTTIAPGATFKDTAVYTDPAFIDWLSPYFRSAFTDAVTACFERGDAARMRAMLDNNLLMTAEQQEQSWLFIAGILEKNIALFDHYHNRGQKTAPAMMPITQISAFIGHGYVEVIRQLPDHRFGRLKDSYAFNMQHPAIAVFNRDLRNRPLTVIWLEEAISLAVSPNTKAVIRAKLAEFNQLMRKRKRRQYFRYAWIGMVVLGVISGFFGDPSSNPGEFFLQKTSTDPGGFTTFPLKKPALIDTSNAVIVTTPRRDSARVPTYSLDSVIIH